MQPRFEVRNGRKPFRLLTHPRFRAAYDFMLLRCESGELSMELGECGKPSYPRIMKDGKKCCPTRHPQKKAEKDAVVKNFIQLRAHPDNSINSESN